MFITLKNTSNQKRTELKQISTSKARPTRAGKEDGYGSSRPACITCQQKKVRCTGHRPDCDRCRSKSLACIFPHQQKSSPNRKDMPPDESDEFVGSGMFDMSFCNIDMEMDMTNLSPSDLHAAYANATAADMSREGNDNRLDQVDAMQLGMSEFDLDLLTTDPSPTSLPSTKQDMPVTLPALDEGGFSPAHAEKSLSGLPPVASTSSEDNFSACSCMYDAVRVLQQLDDDDFRMCTLNLDQVLRLQKRFILHCSSTFDCSKCNSMVHTVLIIICDRLTDTFECICRRMQKLSLHTFASTPGLFIPEMQALYSDQEQVHLIKALLQLQIENFQELLDRMYKASQVSGSQARCTKIQSMITRFCKAKSNIDSALQAILQVFLPTTGIQSVLQHVTTEARMLPGA